MKKLYLLIGSLFMMVFVGNAQGLNFIADVPGEKPGCSSTRTTNCIVRYEVLNVDVDPNILEVEMDDTNALVVAQVNSMPDQVGPSVVSLSTLDPRPYGKHYFKMRVVALNDLGNIEIASVLSPLAREVKNGVETGKDYIINRPLPGENVKGENN